MVANNEERAIRTKAEGRVTVLIAITFTPVVAVTKVSIIHRSAQEGKQACLVLLLEC